MDRALVNFFGFYFMGSFIFLLAQIINPTHFAYGINKYI